jgi:hypothetical protein
VASRERVKRDALRFNDELSHAAQELRVAVGSEASQRRWQFWHDTGPILLDTPHPRRHTLA